MTDAIEGSGGAYVPCNDLASPLPADPAGAITGSDVGFVPRSVQASPLAANPSGAITGSDVGLVEACTTLIIGGYQFTREDYVRGDPGSAAQLSYSFDALDWTPTFPGFVAADPGGFITAATWSPELGLFLIGGGAGTFDYISEGMLATSPDGIDWTLGTSGFGPTSFVSCATWSPELGLFLIGGTASGGGARVATSPDGINWTQSDPGFGLAGMVRCATWSPELGLFLIGGEYAGFTIFDAPLATSANGITWTAQSPGFGAGYPDSVPDSVNCATWSPELGLFLIGGWSFDQAGGYVPPQFSAQIATSPNGSTWTQHEAGFHEQVITAATWSPELGLFLIGSSMGNSLSRARVAVSSNGYSWSLQNLDVFVGTGVSAAAWSADLGLFLAGGHWGQLWTSPNGYSWTERSSGFGPLVQESIYAIATTG